jgi:nuclear pore complex protein Nup188
MSGIPSVAETLAVDGVLSQLASAKIMRLYTRAKGMGPFDNPTRLHLIWSRGILPLCLNLLDAVGAPIAAEVVSFLNTFPAQLARLGSDLSNRSSAVGIRPTDSHLTLSLATETHSLSLLWLVIERYRAAGAASGTLATDISNLEWDKAGAKDDVDDFVLGRSSVGPLVVPANEREAELVRLRPVAAGSKAQNRLEERILVELAAASECLRGDII